MLTVQIQDKIQMNIHEDHQPSKGEKITRFICGALLGFFVGIFFVARLRLLVLEIAIIVVLGAVLICGFLALKYGDEFWHSIFQR